MLLLLCSNSLEKTLLHSKQCWDKFKHLCGNLRGFLVVMLIAGRKGPVPAVLKALTVRKYCVFPARPLTVTEVWFQGTLTFPMVSGFVSSSQ